MSRYHINIVDNRIYNRICVLLILISAIVFQFTIAGNAGNIGTEKLDTVRTLGSISIVVTSPNGGENWIKGTTNTITWSSYGNPGAYVRIELLKGGIKYKTISYLTPNDGSYDWSIPSGTGISIGSNYKVKITSVTNSKYNDTSDNNFAISDPGAPVSSIVVTSPNGGENWMRNTTKTISWSSVGNVGANIKIELLKGGILDSTIVSSVANGGSGGSYSWNIPAGQNVGSDYKVRIVSTTNSLYNDTSDNNFTISTYVPPVAGITVLSPNGGESWKRATIRYITWSSVGNVGTNVKIELYKGDVLSRTIASSTPNDGRQIWIVPFAQETGNNFRVKITSTSNSGYYDWSDNYFSIVSI